MPSRSSSQIRMPLKLVVLAGSCGGLAEVAWVAAYANLTGISGSDIARQVTASVIPAVAGYAAAPLIGVLIHIVLSVALGIGFAWLVWRHVFPQFGPGALVPVAVATLALVWSTNFFVLLPLLNPAFVALMPLAATFTSKMLFALAMAAVLRQALPVRAVE